MHRTICDFTLDLIHNSIEAGATLVVVDFVESEHDITLFVADNGPGMSEELLAKVKDPFVTDGIKHQHREVGLGLAFLAQAVELAGGEFDFDSRKEHGTSVKIRFDMENIDTPPLGDVAETFLAAFTYPGEHELVFNRSRLGAQVSYSVLRSELKEAAGGLDTIGSLSLIRSYLKSQEEEAAHAVVSRKK